MYILLAIVMFSVLIFVHELGHFATAKLFGVQVNEFSMFMGPAIWKKQMGETLYAIRCIPIGGYCSMEGEDGESDNPRAFSRAVWWKRLVILLAGAAMNFLIGVVIFAVLFFPTEQISDPILTEFTDCCTFNTPEGLQLGDEILSIDGEKIYTNSNVSMLLGLNPTGVHDIVVLRDGEKLLFQHLSMAHTHINEDGTSYRHYGIVVGQARPASFADRAGYVWSMVLDNVRNIRLSLQMLLTGQAGLGDMTGVVGIVDMMSDVAESAPTWVDAMLNMLYFAGFLTVNLGVMNLLPIPALDGGRAVCLLLTAAYEGITKRKLDGKYEAYLHGAGMILLLGLMAVITFKDIFNIFTR